MKGFIVHRWLDRWNDGIKQNMEWIKQGNLVFRETVINGFENTYDGFVNMLEGKNIGKTVVKV